MQLVHRIDNNRFIPVEQVTEIFLISSNEKQIKGNIEFYERQLEQLKSEIEYLELNQKTFEQGLNIELVEKTKKELKIKKSQLFTIQENLKFQQEQKPYFKFQLKLIDSNRYVTTKQCDTLEEAYKELYLEMSINLFEVD